MRRVFALLGLFAALVVAWLSLLPSQAVAAVEGPCTTSIDNVNVTIIPYRLRPRPLRPVAAQDVRAHTGG